MVTDPARLPDPVAASQGLPAGAGVIYRAFGASNAELLGAALRRTTRAQGLILLVGADWRLARRIGADGVHLPERLAHLAPRLRRAHPRWLITAAAHSRPAIVKAGRLGLDAILVSAVFASRSPSAKSALGPVRFAALANQTALPVIALGGISSATAPRLRGSSAAGLAAVEAFSL
jgi:thiamine-phosphate pyrophosphorylase